MRRRPMLSGDGLLCRMSGARTGIAPNVIRAFPAAREDGVLSSGGRTQISGRRVIQNVAPPREGAHKEQYGAVRILTPKRGFQ